MKILLTGASSFTGYWFVRELAVAGHDVVATFRRRAEEYPDEVRRRRVAGLAGLCRPVVGGSFGDDAFLDLVRTSGPWDVFCCHAADATNYKSMDFDVCAAVAANTRNLPVVLDLLKAGGCSRVVLTGTVFEQNEGLGSEGLRAFSPYGLSKGLTSDVVRYWCGVRGMRLGKFVISNAFGPFEEARFTAYLVRTWKQGRTPAVNTPAYIRDNVHVSLLAKAYVRFVERLGCEPGFERLGPSQYIESQGAFACRFAKEMEMRLGVPCPVELRRQTEFPEPRVRLNTDPLDPSSLGWDEATAWDEVAAYYKDLPW